jgi:predicted Zn-dependent protease
MKKLFFLLLVSCLLAACAMNALTGRKQLNLVSESELQAMALTQYRSFLDSSKVVSKSSNSDAAMVGRVGERIAAAITKYYQAEGKSSLLDGYKWEFNTVQSSDVNAWCMPGGKVVVYTGLLPVTKNETALAIVMGHEIAHAVARHGNERMSEAMIQQLGGQALQIALAKQPAQTQNLFMLSYGIGSQVGAMLPFSRQQEMEADKYGLIFAAMAGYDPQEAIPFWERMAAMGGTKPPEFLSTHPSDATRIAKLKKIMPEVLKYYKPSAR